VFGDLVGRMSVHMRDQGIIPAVGCWHRKQKLISLIDEKLFLSMRIVPNRQCVSFPRHEGM
jgi:hypothetical protein